jgi:RNA-directed DNA polymerase
MAGALTSVPMSPGLLKVMERAKREPEGRFHALAHLIDEPALERSYHRLHREAAVGVDGVTKEQYGQNLGGNLRGLLARLRSNGYRHQPIRRVHIPKGQGKTRPIGISTFEDKMVQDAVREVLEAIYEQDFLDCSYGFRPGRSAHDALRALNHGVLWGEVKWILEADIVSFFDSLDRNELKRMLQIRVADGALLRLIGKCLHVGVLDGTEYSEPDVGTTQGSVLSPLLGNIYLHYVLDVWFAQQVKPRMKGIAFLIRYADDFVMAFQHQDDAERVKVVLDKRMGRFGLTLHSEKTRLLSFERPSSERRGKGPATFDFLGFTLYWRRSPKGRWVPTCKTQRGRLRRAFRAASDWCRRQRHLPVDVQHASLTRRLQGHINYFGVNGNLLCVRKVVQETEVIWRRWLGRRSQRGRMSWKRFREILERYPLPRPRIVVRIWGPKP